jgi:uncharacterized membrane protein
MIRWLDKQFPWLCTGLAIACLAVGIGLVVIKPHSEVTGAAILGLGLIAAVAVYGAITGFGYQRIGREIQGKGRRWDRG